MEASSIYCGGLSASIFGLRRQCRSISLYQISNRRIRVCCSTPLPAPSPSPSPIKRRRRSSSRKIVRRRKDDDVESPMNGDPLGRRDLGKAVVKWISQGMKAMALDFAMAEMEEESEFSELMGPGLTFVIQAQPYLNAVPMPIGMEVACLKACTHYPTLFDHFQRELRDILQQLQNKSLISDWRQTHSWTLLKDLANSAQHRAIARKTCIPKSAHGVLGLQIDKIRAIQGRIDDFTNHMSQLLRIERDAELEFTEEELNAIPTPDENSAKPIEFLVSHSQTEQELCDTICNLNAVSTYTGSFNSSQYICIYTSVWPCVNNSQLLACRVRRDASGFV